VISFQTSGELERPSWRNCRAGRGELLWGLFGFILMAATLLPLTLRFRLHVWELVRLIPMGHHRWQEGNDVYSYFKTRKRGRRNLLASFTPATFPTNRLSAPSLGRIASCRTSSPTSPSILFDIIVGRKLQSRTARASDWSRGLQLDMLWLNPPLGRPTPAHCGIQPCNVKPRPAGLTSRTPHHRNLVPLRL